MLRDLGAVGLHGIKFIDGCVKVLGERLNEQFSLISSNCASVRWFDELCFFKDPERIANLVMRIAESASSAQKSVPAGISLDDYFALLMVASVMFGTIETGSSTVLQKRE